MSQKKSWTFTIFHCSTATIIVWGLILDLLKRNRSSHLVLWEVAVLKFFRKHSRSRKHLQRIIVFVMVQVFSRYLKYNNTLPGMISWKFSDNFWNIFLQNQCEGLLLWNNSSSMKITIWKYFLQNHLFSSSYWGLILIFGYYQIVRRAILQNLKVSILGAIF